MSATAHTPVLVREVVEALALKREGAYLDATYGRGGHSRAILDHLGDAGRLDVVDRDPEAIAHARAAFAGDPRVRCVQASFSQLRACAERGELATAYDGIVVDLGVSSPQLDDPDRGFSFLRDGALDMRMDPGAGVSAADWLAGAEEAEIARVLFRYGEEPAARRIARAIARAREQAPITRTGQLAAVIEAAIPRREPGRHPATRAFQAIRIHINGELDEIDAVLPQLVGLLAEGGRLAMISFHSLEDRRVKRFLREQARGDFWPPDFAVRADMLRPTLRLVGRAVRPGQAEVQANPRARSSVLRVAERTAHAAA